jgi:hypothetical protein
MIIEWAPCFGLSEIHHATDFIPYFAKADSIAFVISADKGSTGDL